MRRNQKVLLLCLTLSMFLFANNSCRKIDFERSKPEDVTAVRSRFFQTPPTTHPSVLAIARSIQRQDAARNFVSRLAKKAGYPVWDKSLIPSRITGTQARGMEDTGSTLFIPFVQDGAFTTNAVLKVTIGPIDTLYRLIYATQYPEFGFNPDPQQVSATSLFHLFALLDREIFGHDFFEIKDRRLLRQNNGIGTGGKVFARLRKQQVMAREVAITICDPTDWVLRYNDEPECPEGCGIDCRHYHHTTMECITTIIKVGDDEPGSPGGSSGGGGENGGGGGTCTQNCNWEDEDPCPENEPGTPATGFECDLGWIPDIPVDRNQVEKVDTTTFDKLAEYEHVNTYVTSSGRLITFPAGARVQVYQNIDPATHSNGAVYGFSINGQRYVAIQKEYVMPGATAIPPPQFTGFYKVVNGRPNFDSLFNPALLVQDPTPMDGLVKVVRMRWVKDPNGLCKIERQVVDYRPHPNTTATVNTTANEVFEIEYASPSSGSQTESTASECPGASPIGPPPAQTQKTLTGYFTESAGELDSFLNNRLQSSVKVYLYDPQTQSVKYTVGQGGPKTLTLGEGVTEANKFRDSAFGPTDADIAVRAYIENGQWQYDVKLNYTTLGNPHPKIANHVQQVVAEIREQAAAEARDIRTVGRQRISEKFPVQGGEEFYKEGMGLLEAISAIWDVGRHIIKEGQMPEFIWDRGVRSNITLTDVNDLYKKSVFKMPSAVGGATDQLVDELTGVMQMVKVGYDFIRHPGRTINTIWNGISKLNGEKIRQFLAAASGYDNYVAGGDRSKYQGGRHSVQVAMIVIGTVKMLNKGQDVVKGAGEEISEVQKFVPDAPGTNAVSDAIKNASTIGKLVRKIDNDKLLTKNIINGEEHVIVIDRTHEVYSGKATHNIEGVNDNVLKASHPDDILDMHQDIAINTEAKIYPQRWIDGKTFEKVINTDPTHTLKVQTASGVNLNGFNKVEQVQIRLPDGRYVVADNVWWKEVTINGQTKFEIVVNETKLSSSAPFTAKQVDFANLLTNGNTNFTLRSKKFAPDFPQNAQIEVKSYVNTIGNGTTGLSNYSINKVY